MHLVQRLVKQELISPPGWLPDNVQYLARTGSYAYGCATATSDWDVYGFAIPPKDLVFPHLRGEIAGFGTPVPRFEQWQQSHIQAETFECDLTVYSIVKFIQLCMDNNPNMLDGLFVPQHGLLHVSPIGQMVRDRRRLFPHKGCFHRFRGYAYSQLSKMQNKERTGGRTELLERFGFDTKFASHVVRLLLECEQLLRFGEMELGRDGELLKAIRGGAWTADGVRDYFQQREKELEALYHTSTLPERPDEKAIKQLLLDCLEHHYGSLADAYTAPDRLTEAMREIRAICERVRV